MVDTKNQNGKALIRVRYFQENIIVMIKTRKDLKLYLTEDAKRNGINKGVLRYYMSLIHGRENAHVYRYLKCLRHYEYHLNNSKRVWHKLLRLYYNFFLCRMQLRYGIRVKPNVCGYGLRIIHLSGGGGCMIGAKKVGNYCGFNAGVLIGTKDTHDNRPVIGDHVAFGPGSKAFGSITIGNNVFVAPNAVVTKDVPDNCIVGGVPAKVLKYKEYKQ